MGFSQTLPIVRLEQETLTFRSLRKQITTKTRASPHSNCGLLRQHSFASRPRCLKCTVQTILGVNTIDAMCCIEILHNDDLETSRRALPGSNSGVGQEDLPDLKEKVSVSFETCLNRCKLTRNQRTPYLALTFSSFPSQFLYHRQSVPE